MYHSARPNPISNTAMEIINGMKFDAATSTLLVDYGYPKACSFNDGEVTIYRSESGRLWGFHKYWPNAFGAQTVTPFCGEERAKYYLQRCCKPRHFEAVFGPANEG